ncbi:MAG: RdgB/HAM1 family non-canonical purine NTP pyrophosphatase [Saprospiraceae bacterium]
MKQLVFATANPNKIAEVKSKLGDGYDFLSLVDIGCIEEIPETTGTLEGNALQKARYVKDKYGYDCFAEDSGLEVDSLDNRPGVDTAHYSGSRDAQANMTKVLEELSGEVHRTARFRAVIALVQGEREELFEGRVDGWIAKEMAGEGGFGYDPIFIPEGHAKTFAQLSQDIKKGISHRSRAVGKLVGYLGEG